MTALTRQIFRSSRFYQSQRRNFFEKADRDWDKAWKLGITPWDLKGTVIPALKQAVEEEQYLLPEKFQNILIPGCGSGYECIYLKEKGFQRVTGLDLSATAIETARQLATQKQITDVKFEVADFFNYKTSSTFDFVLDYLFFAAIDPPLRSEWATAVSSLITPEDGLLATLIFPIRTEADDPNVGPPYPVLLDDYGKYLQPLGFEIVKVTQVTFYPLETIFLICQSYIICRIPSLSSREKAGR